MFMVTVDSENKTRIVCQALFRNEPTDSFAFVLEQYTALRHGQHPDVSLCLFEPLIVTPELDR